VTEAQAAGPTFRRLLTAGYALESGDADVALRLVPATEEAMPYGGQTAGVQGVRAAVLLARGDTAQARTALERWFDQFDEASPLQRVAESLASAGDALCALADDAQLQRIAEYLERFPTLRFWPPFGTGPDHLRGAIALRLDRVDEAEQHFRAGLEWARGPDVRFWLDEGRNLQGLGEVAERRGDHALAMRQLDAAAELFAKHGARLYLDQVLAKKQILKA
jgi:tetratricopeptide (TPR) repeat protein